VVVIRSYGTIAYASYGDTLSKAKALETAVKTFAASPTEATFAAAKQAWIDSRPAYEWTEGFRFYGGPIDNKETGPEARINAWPLDEAYIDYVEDPTDKSILNDLTNKSIINDPKGFPTIDVTTLAAWNEKGGEKNISSGYHAIEFLLWGQDFNANGPGDRSYKDYVSGTSGTHQNQDRRKNYLVAATELLVKDLEQVTVQWNPQQPDSYVSQFLALPAEEALSNVFKGLGSLVGSELARERLNNVYSTKDQEEEHSCFSDTTSPIDNVYPILGVQGLYTGTYATYQGVGVDQLVQRKDAALDAKIKSQLQESIAAAQAIPAPFDQAFLGDDSSPGRQAIMRTIDALKALASSIAEAADALGLRINFDVN
jgi:putative iron-regulated protein